MKHLLCFGDSITDCGRIFDFPPLGNGYVQLLNEQLKKSANDNIVINLGFDGFTINRILGTIQKQAIPADSCCTILAGINDIFLMLNTCRTPAQQQGMMQDFFSTYEKAVQTILKSTNKLILIEPFVFSQPSELQLWIPYVQSMSTLIKKLADKYSLPFLFLQDCLNDAGRKNGISSVTTDGIHLTASGHRILADKLYKMLYSYF